MYIIHSMLCFLANSNNNSNSIGVSGNTNNSNSRPHLHHSISTQSTRPLVSTSISYEDSTLLGDQSPSKTHSISYYAVSKVSLHMTNNATVIAGTQISMVLI